MLRFFVAAIVSLSVCRAITAQDLTTLDLNYDPSNGNLHLATNLVDEIAIVNIVSSSGIFTGELGKGLNDRRDHLVGVFRGRQFGAAGDIGKVAQTGLTVDFLKQDLCVDTNDISQRTVAATLNGMELPISGERCPIPPDPNRPTEPGELAVFHYNSATGNLRLDVSEDSSITVMELISPQGVFTGDPAQGLGSVFDVDTDVKIFKVLASGFGDSDFGNVVQTGLSNNEFLSSVCAVGAWLPKGRADFHYQYPGSGVVPIAPVERNTCRGTTIPAIVNVAYDPELGHFAVSAEELEKDPLAAQEAIEFVTLEITSESGIFTNPTDVLNGPNDVFSSRRIVKHDPNGFEKLVLNDSVRLGLSAEFIATDISIDAVTTSHHQIGEVRVVPEPKVGLLGCGTAMWLVLAIRRRHRS